MMDGWVFEAACENGMWTAVCRHGGHTVVTEAKTVARLRVNVAEAFELAAEGDPGAVCRIEFSGLSVSDLERFRAARDAQQAAVAAYRAAWKDVLDRLGGMSNGDAAEILGVSRQRVAQAKQQTS